MQGIPNEAVGEINQLAHSARSKNGICLAPRQAFCKEPTIRSHSVQNSRVLDRLQVDGHLYHLAPTAKNDDIHVRFRRISRNQATTFKGLCSKHDQELFCTLDNAYLENLTRNQMNLLAWRASTHEIHQKLSHGTAHQRKMLEIEEQSKMFIDPKLLGIEAISWMFVGHEHWKFREEFITPSILAEENELIHKSFKIALEVPAIALSGMSIIPRRADDDEPPRLIVNIFPVSDDTTKVIFSFVRRDIKHSAPYVREVIENGKINTRKLSALVLSHFENFVVSPRIYSSWSEEKKSAIIKLFVETIDPRSDQAIVEAPDLFS